MCDWEGGIEAARHKGRGDIGGGWGGGGGGSGLITRLFLLAEEKLGLEICLFHFSARNPLQIIYAIMDEKK